MERKQADVAIVGAGIVGLAHAYALAKQGRKVVVFERNKRAVGASIRNFGLIWPIGQATGAMRERALRSREVWLEVAPQAGLWCAATGSLHLAYQRDEYDVLVEYFETTPEAATTCALLKPEEVARKSQIARQTGLLGGLWSSTELNVDPRQAIAALPSMLERRYGVEFRFGAPVNGITMPFIESGSEQWRVEHVFVCSGPDFETLYPAVFAASGITKCKLQMLRTVAQGGDWELGPSLCAGLTLLHYAAFQHCSARDVLMDRVRQELPFYVEQHIHVLLSQTARGELTIGDSHAYGLTHDPFEYEAIDRAILTYLASFAEGADFTVAERWHGVYPILRGQSDLVLDPEAGVTIVNGLSGAGMTLSFGLAEEVVARTLG
ncbi:MAG: TIGR03364 family FAD-dependent oxidoreductase [Herpetosiphon sp.]